VGAARPQAVPLHSARARAIRTRVVLPLGLLTLGLLGWGGSSLRSLLEQPPTTGGIYREAVVAESIEFGPLAAEEWARDPDLTSLLLRGLVQVDEHGEIRPDLAERWTVSADGRIYRFLLRAGLRWDDGQPLTSADVVHTVQQAAVAYGDRPQAAFWNAVSVRAIDSQVVEFTLSEPLGAFLEHAALPLIPAHVPPVSRLPAGSGADSLPSSGPYRVVAQGTDAVLLERNALYHGPPAKLERLEFHLMRTREAALQALASGQADSLTDLSKAEQAYLSNAGRFQIYEIPEFNKYSALVLNTQGMVFQERSVRQATARAIDREALVEIALDGAGEPAVGPISPLSWAFDLALQPHSHDPPAAQELLESLGWHTAEPGRPRQRGHERLAVSLLTSDAGTRLPEAVEIARQLGAVGFEVRVEPLPLEHVVHRLETGDFHAALIGRWLPHTDPDQFSLWHSTQARGVGTNDSAISSPELDRWLEIGRRKLGPDERTDAYRGFQATWLDEQPSVLLYHPMTAYAVNAELRGLRMGPIPDASWRLKRLPEWHRHSP
jgi:peptide/nickel transport system substrate-binding protein